MKTSTDLRIRTVFFLTALLAVALVACGTAVSAQDRSDDEVTLTVLLYSGRPNPSVGLDDDAVARLAEMLGEVPEDEQSRRRGSVLPSILGYNGVLVNNPGGRPGLPRRLAVYGGAAELIGDRGSKRFVRDTGGAIESFLLEVAEERDALDPDQTEAIRAARDEKGNA